MAALYPGTSVSGYNSSPPPDDGSTGSTNLITWNTDVKGKIGDPLNTFATNVDSNITSAFGKTIDGAAILSEGISYQVLAADQGKLIKATASGITITTPDATSVNAPFMFAVNNQSTGTITLAGANPGVQQNVDGVASQTVQAGGSCIVKTDGSNWFTIGLKPATNALGGNNYGFTDPVNVQLVASVATNILTVALKTKAGNDPSVGDPVLIPFRDSTIANGDPVWITINSALSINTNATGATLGTQSSNIPFRLWVLMFNNAGTPVMALWQSGAGSSAIAINPLNESTLQSTTGISAAATSAGVFYTPNGTALSSKAFRILGYLDYTGGLATAGTYASGPSIIQLFGPGIKKPGDAVQWANSTRSSNDTATSTSFTTTGANLAVTLTPSAAANIARIAITTNVNNSTGGDGAGIAVMRGGNVIGVSNSYVNASGTTSVGGLSVDVFDAPGTASSATWTCGLKAIGGGTATFHNNNAGGGSMTVTEIMA